MPLPSDGYAPDELMYRLRDPLMMVDVIRVDVWLGNDSLLPRDQVDDLIRPHVQAAFDDLRIASANPDLRSLAEYRGARIDDLTPPPPGEPTA